MDTSSLLLGTVVLGEYCLEKRAFVNCSLQYPREDVGDVVNEWHPATEPMKLEAVVKQQQPSQKRERFTSAHQTEFIPL